MKLAIRSLLVLILLVGIAAVPADARSRGVGTLDRIILPPEETNAVSDSIVDLAVATPELSTLVEAVLKSGLATTLDEDGEFTVFAPTNAAFAAAGIVPADIDAETLASVLLDHVAPGNFSSKFLTSQSRSGERLPTLGGLTLGVDVSPLSVNGSRVVFQDIRASNGRVFVIDAVLTRPEPSIADRAIAAPDLSTLVEAVVKAGLVPTLDEGGPFTVFAPTNAAFEKIGVDPAVVDAETLAAVLQDHVVPGEFTSAEIVALRLSGGKLRTLGGLDLDFRIFPFRVNGVRIRAANVSAGNGIIYVIDEVLLDPQN